MESPQPRYRLPGIAAVILAGATVLAACGGSQPAAPSTPASSAPASSAPASSAPASSAPASAAPASAAPSSASASAAAPATSPSASQPKVTLKYSCPCTTGPKQSPQTTAMTRFADEVKQLTNGAVTIKLFPNGSLLGQNVEFQGLEKGSTDIADTDPNQWQPQVPALQILLVPYLYTHFSQAQTVFHGADVQKLVQLGVQKAGVRVLDVQNLGARELNLTITKKIETPADLNGVKLRMPPGPYWAKLGQAMGAKVTPVAFNEIYLALQTGTVQGQDNPVATDVANRFYEVTKQLILTNHVFSPIMPAINEKAWKKLSPSEQTAVTKAMRDADAWANQQIKQGQDKDIKFMEKHGLKVYSPNTKAFQSAVLKAFVCDPTFTKAFPSGLLSSVEKSTGAATPTC
ncbi:MAG: DctP family TRAP transporter solute-binding subunit [Chloroflexota bacterium]